MKILLAVLLLGVLLLFFLMRNAPEGYENETGFHYRKKDE